ncbi:MAG: TonB-dependent receptor, partial [Bacteroidota bacterium]
SDYFYDRTGVIFKWNRRKYIFSTGADVQYSKLDGKVAGEQLSVVQDFWALLPSASFNYDFAATNSLSFDYRTNIREPSLEQLQPILDNTNPLSLYVGNPNLKPEYNHRLNLRYRLFDQFNFRSFFAAINTTYTEDKITNSTTIDSFFVQTTQPVNVKNDWNTSGYLDFSTPLKFIRSKINLRFNANNNRSSLFLNGIENTSNRWNTSIDFTIENRKKEIFDVLFGLNWGYNQTTYSESKNFDQQFNTLTYFTDWTLNLKRNWTIGTSFDYTLYRGEDFTNRRQVPMWNASVSKPILKSRGTVEFSVRDLLNQGIGVDRRSTLNYIEDIRINSLARYFMLTFSYSLTVLGDQNKGGILIESGRRKR